MSIESLVRHLSAVGDPRCQGKIEHRLIDILVIAVVGGLKRPIGPFIGALIYTVLSVFSSDILHALGMSGERFKLVEQALRAGKHVLSQKPFVLDLAQGEKLVALAQRYC